MTFRVGQKVTQIRPVAWNVKNGETIPQFGVVYTVRAINVFKAQAFLHFCEIKNQIHPYADDAGEMDFLAKFFRPIVEHKTDISIFTRMLNPSRENMDA